MIPFDKILNNTEKKQFIQFVIDNLDTYREDLTDLEYVSLYSILQDYIDEKANFEKLPTVALEDLYNHIESMLKSFNIRIFHEMFEYEPVEEYIDEQDEIVEENKKSKISKKVLKEEHAKSRAEQIDFIQAAIKDIADWNDKHVNIVYLALEKIFNKSRVKTKEELEEEERFKQYEQLKLSEILKNIK